MACYWFWRSDHTRPKLSTHSALKPNLAQVRVLLAHALIVSFARPFKTFFSPFPIVSGRSHRFYNLGSLSERVCAICDACEQKTAGRNEQNFGRVSSD
jgi:hypothetical protein